MYGLKINKCDEKPEREAIHSGHFMVSHFEAEAQDDEDELAVPLPETGEVKIELSEVTVKLEKDVSAWQKVVANKKPQLGIDGSLTKLFQCMSLAYRQKLTSPKWNRFRGIRLRWKDKIRLNNVIWRCWHLQFIKKENTLICQFASPLDVDTHNKPEAVVLEGKYWKRKLAAVTAEYKKWRMFYRNQALGHNRDTSDMLTEMELMAWDTPNTDDSVHMMVDEDYMGLMSDTLFSTITNQPFPFPDTRELAKAGLADFIQPSLGPLQPNLDDYMDTFEPFHDLITEKLPTVPEENPDYKQGWYPELDLLGANTNLQMLQNTNNAAINTYQMQPLNKEPIPDTRIQPYDPSNRMITYGTNSQLYNSARISSKDQKTLDMNSTKISQNYEKTVRSNTYGNYVETNASVCSEQKLQGNATDSSSYRIPPQQVVMPNVGYKFPQPTTPNVKFASHSSYKPAEVHKEEKITARPRVVGTRGRQRSRSNTREPLKKPPLTSAVSDPSLINSSNSALLTQLLTNNDSSNTFTQNHRMNSSHDNLSLTSRVKDEQAAHPVPILPQPPPATLIITSVKLTPMNAALNMSDPLLLNTMSASNSPVLDSNQCLNSPTSSQGSIGSPTRDGSNRDQRRVGNIHAEQKRRYNIKNGFDRIHSLIPHLNQNPNTKLSKAAMLQKGAEYIKQLRSERNLLKDEMDTLRQQIEALNSSISNCQSLLPATGAPVARRRDNKMQEMFDEYVRTRTLEDWKFWIFSLIFRPLLASFNNFVSTSSVDDLYRSTLLWVEQHCTLVDLRPVVLNSLRYLCTKTDILSEPEKLPEEARQIVLTNQSQQMPM